MPNEPKRLPLSRPTTRVLDSYDSPPQAHFQLAVSILALLAAQAQAQTRSVTCIPWSNRRAPSCPSGIPSSMFGTDLGYFFQNTGVDYCRHEFFGTLSSGELGAGSHWFGSYWRCAVWLSRAIGIPGRSRTTRVPSWGSLAPRGVCFPITDHSSPHHPQVLLHGRLAHLQLLLRQLRPQDVPPGLCRGPVHLAGAGRHRNVRGQYPRAGRRTGGGQQAVRHAGRVPARAPGGGVLVLLLLQRRVDERADVRSGLEPVRASKSDHA